MQEQWENKQPSCLPVEGHCCCCCCYCRFPCSGLLVEISAFPAVAMKAGKFVRKGSPLVGIFDILCCTAVRRTDRTGPRSADRSGPQDLRTRTNLYLWYLCLGKLYMSCAIRASHQCRASHQRRASPQRQFCASLQCQFCASLQHHASSQHHECFSHFL